MALFIITETKGYPNIILFNQNFFIVSRFFKIIELMIFHFISFTAETPRKNSQPAPQFSSPILPTPSAHVNVGCGKGDGNQYRDTTNSALDKVIEMVSDLKAKVDFLNKEKKISSSTENAERQDEVALLITRSIPSSFITFR